MSSIEFIHCRGLSLIKLALTNHNYSLTNAPGYQEPRNTRLKIELPAFIAEIIDLQFTCRKKKNNQQQLQYLQSQHFANLYYFYQLHCLH